MIDTITRAQQWGRNVVARRNDINMSQRSLAGTAATTQQTISRVELGQQTPSDELRVRIAKALACRVSDLFTYEDEA